MGSPRGFVYGISWSPYFGFWILDFGLPTKSTAWTAGKAIDRSVETPLSDQSKIQNPKLRKAERPLRPARVRRRAGDGGRGRRRVAQRPGRERLLEARLVARQQLLQRG